MRTSCGTLRELSPVDTSPAVGINIDCNLITIIGSTDIFAAVSLCVARGKDVR